jgi:excinuclease ABC subunit B
MISPFILKSDYAPAGDQPQAIAGLVSGIETQKKRQTLLGVTGSGKTFTMANVIAKTGLPTLVIAHNKTLAAQLCNEFREFFPQNAVEYFVSYYDYYQPEAYMPNSDTYIEKEAQINDEIDRLRHASTQAILSRKDTIIIASVSAIYGLGSPKEYENVVLHFERGQQIDRRQMLEQLIDMQFERTTSDLTRATFRMRGNSFEIMPVNEERIYRMEITDKIEQIEVFDPVTRNLVREQEDMWLFPAKHYVASLEMRERAIISIKEELKAQLELFKKKGMVLEYERIKRRVQYDVEMIANVGYCNGIENYSRHFDGRSAGQPPFTLIDYFRYAAGDFLTIIDESHVTLPQIRAMYNGDQARKATLVDHGFRLPSAKDNRPLTFDEFNTSVDNVVYVSATPNEYELNESEQVVEQIVRPTGLIDPEIIIHPVTEGKEHKSQVEDVMIQIKERIDMGERALVTTLTKKMAEDLTEYLEAKKFKVKYLHSDIHTLERIEVIHALRKGDIDVIIGVNLLREGLDMPEVSLVAILDADKEGFLRSETSLIQTIGRAARNVNGQVILYADEMTGSMERAIAETDRRRAIQLAYNKANGITPETIQKSIRNILEEFGISATKGDLKKRKKGSKHESSALDLELLGDARPLSQIIKEKESLMKEAATNLQFELAAVLRDEVRELKAREQVTQKKKKK